MEIWFEPTVGLRIKTYCYEEKFWYNFLHTEKSLLLNVESQQNFENIKLSTSVVILNDILSGIIDRNIYCVFLINIHSNVKYQWAMNKLITFENVVADREYFWMK